METGGWQVFSTGLALSALPGSVGREEEFRRHHGERSFDQHSWLASSYLVEGKKMEVIDGLDQSRDKNVGPCRVANKFPLRRRQREDLKNEKSVTRSTKWPNRANQSIDRKRGLGGVG